MWLLYSNFYKKYRLVVSKIDNLELINELEALKPELVDYAEMVGSPVPSSYGIRYVYTDPSGYILDEAIERLRSQKSKCRCSGCYMQFDGVGWNKCGFTNGRFHQFGNSYEEFESGPGNYTTAIVELEDGQIVEAIVSSIKFER